MSSQDMQFADPEWRPPEEREENANSRDQKTSPPRPINANRYEQPQGQTVSPPQEGYLGQGYAGSQPQTTWSGPSRPTPRRQGSPWRWIILAFIIIALMSGAFSRGFSGGGGPGPQPSFSGQSQSFTFLGASTIVINAGAGDINIHAGGSGNSVIIQETTDGGPFGNPRNAIVTPILNGNTINVKEDQGGNSDTSFDVTVPTNEDLQLTTTDGSIRVDGVSGQISLQSDNGDITVQNSQGPVSLQSNNGSINATNDVLAGSSTLSSQNGDVTFSGSIDPGSYKFQSNSGSVNVTLPSTSNFQVNATANSGSINSDFSSVKITGTQANGTVGNPSAAKQAQLTLTSDSGNINLNKAS